MDESTIRGFSAGAAGLLPCKLKTLARHHPAAITGSEAQRGSRPTHSPRTAPDGTGQRAQAHAHAARRLPQIV